MAVQCVDYGVLKTYHQGFAAGFFFSATIALGLAAWTHGHEQAPK
jgi:hypothetical protein